MDSVPAALREAPNLTKIIVLRIGVGDLIEAFYLTKRGVTSRSVPSPRWPRLSRQARWPRLSSDVAVEGSDAFADYREQLLPWSECEPQVADYCQAVELPATAAGFVKHLQEVLATTAKRVDAALPSSGHVVINDKGEPRPSPY